MEPLPTPVTLQHSVVPLAGPTTVAVGLLLVHLVTRVPAQGQQLREVGGGRCEVVESGVRSWRESSVRWWRESGLERWRKGGVRR